MSARAAVLSLLSLASLLAACAGLGSNAIRGGRGLYNSAIVATNNEQILETIVRMRYLEPGGMLAVSSVTANMRVQANVGAQFGIGPESYFSGNLVPLSAGALYEENPTITYAPVQGQDFLRQMLAPIPLDLTLLMFNALGTSPAVFRVLLTEINDIRQDQGDGAAFEEVTAVLASLHHEGALVWAETKAAPPTFELIVRGSGASIDAQKARLRDLLHLGDSMRDDSAWALRIYSGVGEPADSAIVFRARSVYELLNLAARNVEVPADHVDCGLAPPLHPCTAPIRIRSSSARPGKALVAVEHHGVWFWIDECDSESKQMFRVIESLTTARMADAAHGGSSMPVLTVPVSR